MADEESLTSLFDVPLSDENDAAVIIPTHQADQDNLSEVRQRTQLLQSEETRKELEEQDRTELRKRRYRNLLDRFIYFIEDKRLLPASWLEHTVESGQRYPVFVNVIQNNWKTWLKTLVSAVSFVASLLWLLQYVLGAPSAVLSSGEMVVNLYQPAQAKPIDLTSRSVAEWISSAQLPPHSDLSRGYAAAPVYQVAETRNVTVQWLRSVLPQVCGETSCDCLSAIEVGVGINAVWISQPKTVMLNPLITQESDVRIGVSFSDGTEDTVPAAIVVEYEEGKLKERKKFSGAKSACVARALGFFKP